MDKYFKACMVKAVEIWKLTDGAFDPTVFPFVNARGFGPEKKPNWIQFKFPKFLSM